MTDQPNFEHARIYALKRLEHELPATMYYHSLAHTREEVVPAAECIASGEGIIGEQLMLLRTAAYYHDLGFIVQSQEHEAISIQISEQALPGFGYHPKQIQQIVGMIKATRLPQSPTTLLEEILADADLDILGREYFWTRNQALRNEWAVTGRPMTDDGWYNVQLKFLLSHHYFTATAQALREELKQKHIAMLARLLAH